jgi:hypothetical protein
MDRADPCKRIPGQTITNKKEVKSREKANVIGSEYSGLSGIIACFLYR